MEVLVHSYLGNHNAIAQEKLQSIFARWVVAGPMALALMQKAPLLNNAEPRAEQLVALGTMGQEALTFIANHQAAPAGWVQTKLALIDQAEKPAGLVRFTVLEPMRELVKAAQ